ncbi:hypothetical protein H2203_008194 [Taxawa tesnikishii (nom. ined.)]|nr:hypothetical protein H2203_008194 [Dothideales sp. JES 119]
MCNQQIISYNCNCGEPDKMTAFEPCAESAITSVPCVDPTMDLNEVVCGLCAFSSKGNGGYPVQEDLLARSRLAGQRQMITLALIEARQAVIMREQSDVDAEIAELQLIPAGFGLDRLNANTLALAATWQELEDARRMLVELEEYRIEREQNYHAFVEQIASIFDSKMDMAGRNELTLEMWHNYDHQIRNIEAMLKSIEAEMSDEESASHVDERVRTRLNIYG